MIYVHVKRVNAEDIIQMLQVVNNNASHRISEALEWVIWILRNRSTLLRPTGLYKWPTNKCQLSRKYIHLFRRNVQSLSYIGLAKVGRMDNGRLMNHGHYLWHCWKNVIIVKGYVWNKGVSSFAISFMES